MQRTFINFRICSTNCFGLKFRYSNQLCCSNLLQADGAMEFKNHHVMICMFPKFDSLSGLWRYKGSSSAGHLYSGHIWFATVCEIGNIQFDAMHISNRSLSALHINSSSVNSPLFTSNHCFQQRILFAIHLF